MAVIKTIEKGESLTFGFVLPETYNLDNLQAVKIYIGSSIYGHEMDGRTVRVELESNKTALITGRNIVHFVIDDAVFGIKKINCGELEVLPTQATHKDESVNTGYDVEIVLSINVETVSIESVLYDTLKGDRGDAGTIEVGTVTTGDAGTDVIVKNVGTPSEAILNFTIPRGNSGDFFSGDYNLIINKQDAKWVDGWLWIDTGEKTYNKKIDVGYMAISTGIGTEQLKPIVHYPAGLTYEFSSIPNGFYLKDEDGRLSENTDFEFLDVRYNILSDTTSKYDGLTKLIGGNAAFDDFDVSHSATMRTIFMQIYEGFTGEVYRAATDILCNNTRIDAHFEPTYARIRNIDIIGIPITNGASTEQSGSNPDILKISSHYNNTFARKDITDNETTFLNNVIAVGSCPDMESPTTGTSFGYGVEFFEDTSRTAQEYPNFGSYGNSQSASTAIITAKFKIIKDATGVSWSIVRKAARVTARKTVGGVYAAGFPWDMYRGFGIIDVGAAIQYIKDNYTENADYLTALSDDVERTRGIDPMLPFENISENTPVPKGKMHEVTENNYIDEDKAKVTELSPLFWDEDNNTFSFPVPDGGMIQIGQEPHDYYTNLQGAQIVNGDIVSVVGATGNRTAIALTDATNDAKALACFGMVTVETIGNNNVGRITKSGGKVRGVNTSGYAEGSTIYVDPLNPGKWTGVKPAAPLRAIQIGVVSVSHAVEGVVELFIKVYPRFGELADVDGITTGVLDAEAVPVKKVDGLIKFLSWSNIKATLKTYFEDAIYKVLQIGGSGLVTLKPTTSHFTYRLNVTENMTLNIDLSRMIQQVGSARCRLIVDMPVVRTVTITKPVLWGGTMPTFAAAGQYIFEIIDVDGSGTPLIWQVASTTKVEPTGVILYVDSAGADYTMGQINGETATRTTSTWAAPFKYLQNAINAAVSGDIIFVKQGIHKPTHLRATPTSYTDGDHLNRNATFTPKNGVDIYGGFLGTESKTWQRVVDDNGHMVNQTILCGDVLNEAVINPAVTVGDRRTALSKANAAYHVLYGSAITSLTYMNGFTLRYGHANGAVVDGDGGGMRSTTNFVAINCIASNNTATNGGGWFVGTNINCIANNNTGINGGGWYSGTNINCIANSNSATTGGGWYLGINTNCIANNNTATGTGGGWYIGTNVNCTGINNRAPQAVFSSTATDTHINCLLFNNKNTSNVAVGFDNKTASGVKIFLNNAYDVAHPTITGGAGSEINTATCIQNLTAGQAKIEVPSFVGNATTPEQLAELEQYVKDMPSKLKPKLGSILKGAGVMRAEVSANDFNGDERLDPCTIGAIEGE